ncbi:IS110 family transposase, partial [Undibacterium sp. NL8W]|nr:IS110 family transposase [Undibacterium umbellatum]
MDQRHGAHMAANLIKKLTCDEIDTMGLGEMEAMALKANLSVMHALNAQIVHIEKTLAKVCATHPGLSLLKSVAGIGDTLA